MKRLLIGVIGLWCLSLAGVQAATIEFNPQNSSGLVGTNLSVDIIGNFSDLASGVNGGSLNLAFDTAIADVAGVTVNTALWNFFPSAGTVDNGAGTVSDIKFNFLDGFNPANTAPTHLDGLRIATVDFNLQSPGVSALTLTEGTSHIACCGGSTPFFSPGGAGTFNPGTLSAVPIPAAAWLMGSGLIGLLGLGRKCRS